MAIEHVEIGALGWTHAGWDGQYYPEDLPADWRLDYYSHHFQVVLMPATEWITAAEDEVRQWLSDVKDSFEFLLSVTPAEINGASRQLQMIRDILGRRLVGIVLSPADELPAPESLQLLASLATVYVDGEPADASVPCRYCWRPGREVSAAALGFISADMAENLRTLRMHIERFVAQAGEGRQYLIFEGQPPSARAMQDAQVILQMLV